MSKRRTGLMTSSKQGWECSLEEQPSLHFILQCVFEFTWCNLLFTLLPCVVCSISVTVCVLSACSSLSRFRMLPPTDIVWSFLHFRWRPPFRYGALLNECVAFNNSITSTSQGRWDGKVIVSASFISSVYVYFPMFLKIPTDKEHRLSSIW